MGLEEVKNTIEAEAKREAKAIIAEGKKEASVIVAAAKKRVDAEEKHYGAELEADLKSLENREIASAEFAARKTLMVKQRELLDSFFQECMGAASSLPVKKRKEHVATLLDRIGKGFSFSVVHARDIPELDGVKCVPIEIAGGVIAENKDGSERVDLTYETMLNDIRRHSLQEIAAKLFGK